MPFDRYTFSAHLHKLNLAYKAHALSEQLGATMEHVEAMTEETSIEHQELSFAELDMTSLYEWLDRPITEDDDLNA